MAWCWLWLPGQRDLKAPDKVLKRVAPELKRLGIFDNTAFGLLKGLV